MVYRANPGGLLNSGLYATQRAGVDLGPIFDAIAQGIATTREGSIRKAMLQYERDRQARLDEQAAAQAQYERERQAQQDAAAAQDRQARLELERLKAGYVPPQTVAGSGQVIGEAMGLATGTPAIPSPDVSTAPRLDFARTPEGQRAAQAAIEAEKNRANALRIAQLRAGARERTTAMRLGAKTAKTGSAALPADRLERYFVKVADDAMQAAQGDPQRAVQVILDNPETADLFTQGMGTRHIEAAATRYQQAQAKAAKSGGVMGLLKRAETAKAGGGAPVAAAPAADAAPAALTPHEQDVAARAAQRIQQGQGTLDDAAAALPPNVVAEIRRRLGARP